MSRAICRGFLGNDQFVQALAAVQPHSPHTCFSTFPLYLFLLRETCEQKAKYRPEPSSTRSPHSFAPQLPALPPPPSSKPSLKYFSFPNPTSALSRLLSTMASSCRRPPSPDTLA
ncbi:hypothetical protein K443DRAFT_611199 [Laccaria amethystina LaAM-08-1]|uniref:Uncharacterized protein n=1 Tax=Laccaria amethystina LaAM-08-1 TaxID=1095629 RepID=A0A0C9XWS9_9AGAR|nr:hypothetical protein K443DRAFT_611199 [Laccaria amethystina LaAM-08-1]